MDLIGRVDLFFRLAVEEAEEALRTEQTRFQELQQEQDQERALNVRKDREKEEQREVRREQKNALINLKLLLFYSLQKL